MNKLENYLSPGNIFICYIVGFILTFGYAYNDEQVSKELDPARKSTKQLGITLDALFFPIYLSIILFEEK